MNYRARNDRKNTKMKKLLVAAPGTALLCLSLLSISFYGIACSVLILSSLLFSKYTVAGENGVTVYYDVKIYQYKENWDYNDISSMHRERVKDPACAALHFTKGAMSKRLIFTAEEAEAIIHMAKERNQSIFFEEACWRGNK